MAAAKRVQATIRTSDLAGLASQLRQVANTARQVADAAPHLADDVAAARGKGRRPGFRARPAGHRGAAIAIRPAELDVRVASSALFGVGPVVAVDWLVFMPERSIEDVEESLLSIVRRVG